jgi:hypothetical protein
MVISVEPTKPYFPAPQYRIELEIEDRLVPIVLLVMGKISDAIGFQGGSEAVFRIPPTWAADAEEEIVNFDFELLLGKKVEPKNLVIKATNELSFMELRIVQINGRTRVQGKCSSSDVPPDTTTGLVSIFNQVMNADGKVDSKLKLDIPVRVINPPPILLLPSPVRFTKDEKSKRWIGKGLVRLDPILLQSAEDSPSFTLTSPDRGTMNSKKLGKLLYSVEVQLIEEDKTHKISEGIEISVVVSGKEFKLKAKVE